MTPLCLFRRVLCRQDRRGRIAPLGNSFPQAREGNDMAWIDDWAASAACKDAGPDALFVRGAEQNRAKQLCSTCKVRSECLAEALENQIEWGVWGGMTERERRALLRRRPNVTSWRAILQAAQPAAARADVAVG